MDIKQSLELIKKIGNVIEENKDYLTELDMPIGDSDHGINMARGFHALEEKIEETEFEDLGALFKTCGMQLVSKVGGSSGPLYGTAFMNIGKLLAGKTEMTVEDYPEILKTALDGIQMRGHANQGEATMVDAILPAYEAACDAAANAKSAKEIADAAAQAAREGAESTIPMLPTKGRASYLGERAIGHKDPGAESAALMIAVIAEEL